MVSEPDPATDPEHDGAIGAEQPAADGGKDVTAGSAAGDAGDPPAGVALELDVRGTPVTGTVRGSSFIVTAAPGTFRTALVASAVQRDLVMLLDEAQASESCREPLGVSDGLNRPTYALRDVLLNPLAANELIRELRTHPEGSQVSQVTNPLKIESIEFDDASIQTGLPRGIVGSELLGSSDFPAGPYDWDLLCRGLGAADVVLRAVVRGSWNGAPHELTIEYTPVHVRAR